MFWFFGREACGILDPRPGIEPAPPALEGEAFVLFISISFIDLFNSLDLFIYLFLAALGLHCCVQAFSSCSEQGLLFVVVHGLLIAVASCCRARALGAQASVVVARGL